MIDAIVGYRIRLVTAEANETVRDFRISPNLEHYEFTSLEQGTAYNLYMTSVGRDSTSLPKLIEFHTRIFNHRRPESCVHVSYSSDRMFFIFKSKNSFFISNCMIFRSVKMDMTKMAFIQYLSENGFAKP